MRTGVLERVALVVYEHWLDRDNLLTRGLVREQGRVHRAAFLATLALYPAFCALSWTGTLGRRALGRKPRVLWGPVPILTIAESSEVLRRLGYPSTTLVLTTYHIRSDFDVNLQRAMSNRAVAYWLQNVLFLWSLLRFDVLHTFYDGGIWAAFNNVPAARWLELPLLRLAGKRVVASAYGADVRVRHLNELWQPYNICRECPQPGRYCVCGPDGLTRAKYYRDWCNAVLALGDMHDFVPDSRRDVNYWPVDVERIPFAGALPRSGPVVIAHSPNHRYFKGTRFLEDAVAALRERGHDIELDLVEGVSNDEARRRYAAADIVFAQCLAGWMGYTELEAMAAGKPVVGYIRDPRYLAHTDGSPLVSATPGTVEAELEALVADAALREDLGIRGRAYVERWWSYEAVSPSYDKLHRAVWEENDLLPTLRRKWHDVRHGEAGYRVGRRPDGRELGEAPVWWDPDVDMRRIASGRYAQPPLDASGIPRTGATYDPALVARWAFDAFHLLLRDPAAADQRTRFTAAARWLRDALDVDDEGVGRWRNHGAVSGRDLDVPWVSCVSQSLGLSILLRAEQLRVGDGYAEAATAAAALFRVPIREHGILSDDDGAPWLEEFPEPRPAHTLGGCLTGLLALHEFARIRDEPWARDLFGRCVLSVERRLAGHGVRARRAVGRRTLPEDERYLLVQQLRALAEAAGRPAFAVRARKWTRRLYAGKVNEFARFRAPL